ALLRVAMTMESPLRSSVRESPITQNVAMDVITQSASGAARLPAQRLDSSGRAHVDHRAVLALALPLMANLGVQIVPNLRPMWFRGRISSRAVGAVGAVQWRVIAVVLVLGGGGTAVQTLVAQAYGARGYHRAAQAVWTALWAMACAAPLFVLMGAARHLILAPFGFDPAVEQLAAAFWYPRGGGRGIGAGLSGIRGWAERALALRCGRCSASSTGSGGRSLRC